MIAYRDLGRNRRRSALTLVAVTLGMALLVVMSALIKGGIEGSLDNSIRLQTGHVQVREESYDEDEVSLEWEDLLNDPQGLATQAQALESVRVATPVLWANGMLTVRDQSVGVQVVGIDPLSEAHAPIRDALTAGEFLAPDDRSGILIGKRLAESLGVTEGSQVSLMVTTADQQPDQAIFTIRGLYSTGVASYDETTVFLPLSKAQAFTRAGERASAIRILLDDREKAEALAVALRAPERSVLNWRELNKVFLQVMEQSDVFMQLMYLVVLAVVAVVIANTLLMSVFERTREMGILAALGMKGRQILVMFLLEAATLGLAGIVLGIVLGGLGVAYLATVGLPIGEAAAAGEASNIITYGNILYARFSPSDTVSLSIAELMITLLASLYPAWLAARLEP
ncbi:MAG: FtsX-like permease family protein, partial [Anaerolineae bacterium]|nr:FtsX-like permease family protein [Anaerolineae bacterium]